MSEAVNNPYKQEAPDKTLSIEGMAADAKAVGDALSEKNALIQESFIANQSTDSNGNIYTNFLTEKVVIIQTWSLGCLVTPFITSDFKWAFHFWDWNTTNIGDNQQVTVWYRYYLR